MIAILKDGYQLGETQVVEQKDETGACALMLRMDNPTIEFSDMERHLTDENLSRISIVSNTGGALQTYTKYRKIVACSRRLHEDQNYIYIVLHMAEDA